MANSNDVSNSRMDQTEVTPEAVRDLSTEAKRAVAHEAVRDLSTADKGAVATTVLQSLPIDATDVRTDVAKDALRSLPAGATDARKDVAKDALESLSAQDQVDVAGSLLQGPTQQVTNRIWLIVIWAFAIVFVLAALMLFFSV